MWSTPFGFPYMPFPAFSIPAVWFRVSSLTFASLAVWCCVLRPEFLTVTRFPVSRTFSVPHIQCESKIAPNTFCGSSLPVNLCNWKLPGYCPNVFLCLHQFLSIYLNIFVKCIIFTGVTPQILITQFSLLRNSWIFRENTSHIKWYLIKYND